jgi:hypothetical protein
MRYYIWGGLLLAVELFFVVHAAKRGRHNWIYIIMFFPVAGCMAYALTYLIPTMRVTGSLEDTGDKIVRKIAPTRKLIKLKNQL